MVDWKKNDSVGGMKDKIVTIKHSQNLRFVWQTKDEQTDIGHSRVPFLLWLKTHYTFELTNSHTHQFYEIHFQNRWKNHVFQKEFCHQICIQTTLPAPVCSVAEERSSEAKDFCQDGLQPGSWIPPCWILPWHWSDLFAVWVSWLVKKVMSATSPENWIKLLQKSETWVEFLNIEFSRL